MRNSKNALPPQQGQKNSRMRNGSTPASRMLLQEIVSPLLDRISFCRRYARLLLAANEPALRIGCILLGLQPDDHASG